MKSQCIKLCLSRKLLLLTAGFWQAPCAGWKLRYNGHSKLLQLMEGYVRLMVIIGFSGLKGKKIKLYGYFFLNKCMVLWKVV